MIAPERPVPLVVIGGSAGAIAPLRAIVGDLGPGLQAAVCVVIHMPGNGRSALDHVLARAGSMHASFGQDGEPLRQGEIHLAPPGRHLLVRDGHIQLSAGATENHARPAIDPLFRTAARARGQRIVSVVLSGTLDDGSAGTQAVRQGGGWTIAQDPVEAEFPDMPANAIATGSVRDVLPTSRIGARIRALVASLDDAPADAAPAAGDGPAGSGRDAPPRDPSLDSVDRGLVGPAVDLAPPASPFSCPACGGVLYEREDHQYLCRLGHRYSPLSLEDGQETAIEDALWTALRTLDEAASLAARVRDRAARRGDRAMERRFEARRARSQARADRIRGVLQGSSDGADAASALDEEDVLRAEPEDSRDGAGSPPSR